MRKKAEGSSLSHDGRNFRRVAVFQKGVERLPSWGTACVYETQGVSACDPKPSCSFQCAEESEGRDGRSQKLHRRPRKTRSPASESSRLRSSHPVLTFARTLYALCTFSQPSSRGPRRRHSLFQALSFKERRESWINGRGGSMRTWDLTSSLRVSCRASRCSGIREERTTIRFTSPEVTCKCFRMCEEGEKIRYRRSLKRADLPSSVLAVVFGATLPES